MALLCQESGANALVMLFITELDFKRPPNSSPSDLRKQNFKTCIFHRAVDRQSCVVCV